MDLTVVLGDVEGFPVLEFKTSGALGASLSGLTTCQMTQLFGVCLSLLAISIYDIALKRKYQTS
jgi:hypothetical protein